MAQFRQRPAEAQKMLARASAVYAAAGLTISQAQAERNLANLLAEDLNERREAEVHYRLALALVERVAGRESSSYADIEASLGIFLAEEDCGAGEAYLEHARSVLEPLRGPSLSSLLGQLGDCAKTSDPDQAAAYYERAIALCTDRACQPGMIEHLNEAVGALLAERPATRARGIALLRHALDGYTRLGDAESAADVKKVISRWGRR